MIYSISHFNLGGKPTKAPTWCQDCHTVVIIAVSIQMFLVALNQLCATEMAYRAKN